jgi:hypothetical protein
MEMESGDGVDTDRRNLLHSTFRPAMAAVESASTQLERAGMEAEASSLLRTLRQHPDVRGMGVTAASQTLDALL